ncbi:molybdate ABC transporter permease subunit [Puniceicoccaceae bacterium K14]|nr:molybdate ABC transporter permease subunit [Puniceicoccaceae bacterium K14]
MDGISTIVINTLLWATLSTCLTLSTGTAIAYVLARYEFTGKNALSTLISLPLVLPPTAVGFLLLRLLADNGILGRDTLGIDLDVLLDWKAVVLACTIMSFPLVVRTARVSIEAVNPRLEQMGQTLGMSFTRILLSITLPLASRGLIAAGILGFTRAVGEFGATIIVAGNIPGRTQTLSSAIYSAHQSGNDSRANTLVFISLAIGFLAIYLTERLSRPFQKKDDRS